MNSEALGLCFERNANPKVWQVTYILRANAQTIYWYVYHRINLNTYVSPNERVGDAVVLYDERELSALKKDLLALGFERTIIHTASHEPYFNMRYVYTSEERLIANAEAEIKAYLEARS